MLRFVLLTVLAAAVCADRSMTDDWRTAYQTLDAQPSIFGEPETSFASGSIPESRQNIGNQVPLAATASPSVPSGNHDFKPHSSNYMALLPAQGQQNLKYYYPYYPQGPYYPQFYQAPQTQDFPELEKLSQPSHGDLVRQVPSIPIMAVNPNFLSTPQIPNSPHGPLLTTFSKISETPIESQFIPQASQTTKGSLISQTQETPTFSKIPQNPEIEMFPEFPAISKAQKTTEAPLKFKSDDETTESEDSSATVEAGGTDAFLQATTRSDFETETIPQWTSDTPSPPPPEVSELPEVASVDPTASFAPSIDDERPSVTLPIESSFSCSNRVYGFYADPENNCTVYHVCHTVATPDGKTHVQRSSFRCGPGSVFSQLKRTCVHPNAHETCESAITNYSINEDFGIVPETTTETPEGQTNTFAVLEPLNQRIKDGLKSPGSPFRQLVALLPKFPKAQSTE